LQYGQTGSGKTHTLTGTAAEPGVIILAVQDVFRSIEAAVAGGDTEFLVRVSYLEIYQEEIRDLLNPDAGQLKIADHPVTGPYVRDISEEVVLSPERVLELMAIGEANRHVAATNMNVRSSRSHTLFRMVIESRKVGGGGSGDGGDDTAPPSPASLAAGGAAGASNHALLSRGSNMG
jgi:centromeric protein E